MAEVRRIGDKSWEQGESQWGTKVRVEEKGWVTVRRLGFFLGAVIDVCGVSVRPRELHGGFDGWIETARPAIDSGTVLFTVLLGFLGCTQRWCFPNQSTLSLSMGSQRFRRDMAARRTWERRDRVNLEDARARRKDGSRRFMMVSAAWISIDPLGCLNVVLGSVDFDEELDWFLGLLIRLFGFKGDGFLLVGCTSVQFRGGRALESSWYRRRKQDSRGGMCFRFVLHRSGELGWWFRSGGLWWVCVAGGMKQGMQEVGAYDWIWSWNGSVNGFFLRQQMEVSMEKRKRSLVSKIYSKVFIMGYLYKHGLLVQIKQRFKIVLTNVWFTESIPLLDYGIFDIQHNGCRVVLKNNHNDYDILLRIYVRYWCRILLNSLINRVWFNYPGNLVLENSFRIGYMFLPKNTNGSMGKTENKFY